MIEVTKMDGRRMLINEDQIETVESNPDTVIVLVSGRKLIVKDKPVEIHAMIRQERS
ncbi:MAG: flagellar FlbD family protein [Butyrivibrio sp.]|nr:flagellar FlbD family protein [Butyrivibrio sp.]